MAKTINAVQRTAKDWFEELEEPYKSQAIRNALAFHPTSLDVKHVDLHFAIRNSFIWPLTPEGTKYWDDLIDKLTPKDHYMAFYKKHRYERLQRRTSKKDS